MYSLSPVALVDDLKSEDVAGDDFCFYHCLSHVEFGCQHAYHSDLRKLMLKHMYVMHDELENILHPGENSKTLGEYFQKKSIDRCTAKWATWYEIFSGANLLKTNIHVYSTNGEQWQEFRADFLRSCYEIRE